MWLKSAYLTRQSIYFPVIVFFFLCLFSLQCRDWVSLKSYELSLFPRNIKIISLSGMLATSKLLVIVPQLLRPVQLVSSFSCKTVKQRKYFFWSKLQQFRECLSIFHFDEVQGVRGTQKHCLTRSKKKFLFIVFSLSSIISHLHFCNQNIIISLQSVSTIYLIIKIITIMSIILYLTPHCNK